MTESDIEECKATLSVMLEVINEVEGRGENLTALLVDKAGLLSDLGKEYLRISSAARSALPCKNGPEFDSERIYLHTENNIQHLLLVGQSFIGAAATQVQSTRKEYAEALAVLDQTKKRITRILQSLQSQTWEAYKSYQRASKDYERAKRNMTGARVAREKAVADPVLRFVVSVQEQNAEKYRTAQREEAEAEKRLVSKQTAVDSQIEQCNHDIAECESEFIEAIGTMLKSMRVLAAHGLLELKREDVETLLKKMSDSVTDVCGLNNFRQKTTARNPKLSAAWLWEDSAKIPPEAAEELDSIVNSFIESAGMAAREVREVSKVLSSLLEDMYQAEGEFYKLLGGFSKQIKKTMGTIGTSLKKAMRPGTEKSLRPLVELFAGISGTLREFTAQQKKLHKNTHHYFQSIAYPRVKKLRGVLDSAERDWRLAVQKAREGFDDVCAEIARAHEDAAKIARALREVKENIIKAGDNQKALEKYLNQQIILNNQAYKKESEIENLKLRRVRIVEDSIRPIRAAVLDYRKSDQQTQAAVCDCINGISSCTAGLLEQYGTMREKNVSSMENIRVEDVTAALSKMLKTFTSPKHIADIPIEEIKESASISSPGPSSELSTPKTEKKDSTHDLPFPQKRSADLGTQGESQPKSLFSPEHSQKFRKSAIQMTPKVASPPPADTIWNSPPPAELPAVSKFESKQSTERSQGKDDWMAKRFGVDEQATESFLCAISWKLILQGTLYITKSTLCFYTPFNNSTLFGSGTTIVIPIAEIVDVKKRYNALIFDNSISIHTKNAEFFFTSFVHRDKAYEMIAKGMEQIKGKPAERLDTRKSAHSPIVLRELSDSYKNFIRRIETIEADRLKLAEAQGLKKIDPLIFEARYDCPIQVLYLALCVGTSRAFKKIQELGDNYDLASNQEAQHPKLFTSYREALGAHITADDTEREAFLNRCVDIPLVSASEITYQHAVKQSMPIPFVPDKCSFREASKYFYISPNWVSVQTDFFTGGVPYCDYFVTHSRLDLRQTVEVSSSDFEGIKYKTTLTLTSQMEFVKSTIFRSKIEGEAMRQSKELREKKLHPFLLGYVEEEKVKFAKCMDELQSGCGTALEQYNVSVPKFAIGSVIIKGLRNKAHLTATCNRVMQNQRKIFSIQLVATAGFILFLLLIVLRLLRRNNNP